MAGMVHRGTSHRGASERAKMGRALSAAAQRRDRRLLQGRMAEALHHGTGQARRCASMAARTMRRPQTAATTPCTSSSVSTLRAGCICSICGAGKRHPTSGSRRSAISSKSGSRWHGRRRPGKSKPVSARSWTAGNASGKRSARENISHARRQGGQRTIHPRPHGAGRSVCPDQCGLVPGLPRRAIGDGSSTG